MASPPTLSTTMAMLRGGGSGALLEGEARDFWVGRAHSTGKSCLHQYDGAIDVIFTVGLLLRIEEPFWIPANKTPGFQ